MLRCPETPPRDIFFSGSFCTDQRIDKTSAKAKWHFTFTKGILGNIHCRGNSDQLKEIHFTGWEQTTGRESTVANSLLAVIFFISHLSGSSEIQLLIFKSLLEFLWEELKITSSDWSQVWSRKTFLDTSWVSMIDWSYPLVQPPYHTLISCLHTFTDKLIHNIDNYERYGYNNGRFSICWEKWKLKMCIIVSLIHSKRIANTNILFTR